MHLGGSEKFQDKQTFFYQEVKKLKNYRIRSEMSFTVDRENILENVRSKTIAHYSTISYVGSHL